MAASKNTQQGRSGTARKAPSAGSGPAAEAPAEAAGGVQPAAPNSIPEGPPASERGGVGSPVPPAPGDGSGKAAPDDSARSESPGTTPTQKVAGKGGKASGAATAVAPEPTHEFLATSRVLLDGRSYDPGDPIALSHGRHGELRQAGAISGDWPEAK